MIIKPKIRGFICTSAHPEGCEKNIREQIAYVKKNGTISNGPQNVLIIGASTGYGLSTRIVTAFGCGARTMGVFFEKTAENKRTATAGWYNTAAFHKAAREEGLYCRSFNGDAFSDEMKNQVVQAVKEDWGKVDMVVYSLASPRRVDPKTGEIYKSILKPIGQSITRKSIDWDSSRVVDVTLQSATDEEIRGTVGVMGGDDWKLWMDALEEAGVLADNCLAVAYSYIGPEVTQEVYRQGTIGRAKEHLEATAKELDQRLSPKGGRALIAVNKALVTQSSSAIPIIPLYFAILLKVMKAKGTDESCIQQMDRLFRSKLYSREGDVPTDEEGRVRVDDLEFEPSTQDEVMRLWRMVDTSNIEEIGDLVGYRKDFLKLFGFGVDGVDYTRDMDPDVPLV